MKRPPFRMKSSRTAALKRDGRHITTGRAAFVWETFLMSRASGVPGSYAIRRGEQGSPWHQLDWTIEEAERALDGWGTFAYRRVAHARRLRQARAERGLPVA